LSSHKKLVLFFVCTLRIIFTLENLCTTFELLLGTTNRTVEVVLQQRCQLLIISCELEIHSLL
jgi:hypothetical protein